MPVLSTTIKVFESVATLIVPVDGGVVRVKEFTQRVQKTVQQPTKL